MANANDPRESIYRLVYDGNIARIRQKIEGGYQIRPRDRFDALWALTVRPADLDNIDLLNELNRMGFGLDLDYITEDILIKLEEYQAMIIGPEFQLTPIIPMMFYKGIEKNREIFELLKLMLYLYSQIGWDENNPPETPGLDELIKTYLRLSVIPASGMRKKFSAMMINLYRHTGGRILTIVELLVHNVGGKITLNIIPELLDVILREVHEVVSAEAAGTAGAATRAAAKAGWGGAEPGAEVTKERFRRILKYLADEFGPKKTLSIVGSRIRKTAMNRRKHILAFRTPALAVREEPIASLADKVRKILCSIRDSFSACSRGAGAGGAAAGAGGGGGRTYGGRRRRSKKRVTRRR